MLHKGLSLDKIKNFVTVMHITAPVEDVPTYNIHEDRRLNKLSQCSQSIHREQR